MRYPIAHLCLRDVPSILTATSGVLAHALDKPLPAPHLPLSLSVFLIMQKRFIGPSICAVIGMLPIGMHPVTARNNLAWRSAFYWDSEILGLKAQVQTLHGSAVL